MGSKVYVVELYNARMEGMLESSSSLTMTEFESLLNPSDENVELIESVIRQRGTGKFYLMGEAFTEQAALEGIITKVKNGEDCALVFEEGSVGFSIKSVVNAANVAFTMEELVEE